MLIHWTNKNWGLPSGRFEQYGRYRVPDIIKRLDKLEDAWIAVVSPMDVNVIWMVARNLEQFLHVLYTDRDVLYNGFATSETYRQHVASREQ